MSTPTLRIILVAENVDEQELNLFHETLTAVMMAHGSYDLILGKKKEHASVLLSNKHLVE